MSDKLLASNQLIRMCRKALPGQCHWIVRPPEIGYMISGSYGNQGHNMIFTELAGRESWLLEPALGVNVISGLATVNITAAKRMFPVGVCVLSGQCDEFSQALPVGRITGATEPRLDIEPTGRPGPIAQAAIRTDSVGPKKADRWVFDEFLRRPLFDSCTYDQGVGIKPDDHARLIPFEQPLITGGYLDPQPSKATGRPGRSWQHDYIRR